MSELKYLGNKDLLNMKKWGFLASRQVPSNEVLPCYDWATTRSKAGDCVVSGFSSKLEKDVLHFLLKGSSPIIVVLARRMYQKLPETWQKALQDNRMLIISTCDAVRQSRQTAIARNQFIAELCDTMYLVENTSLKKRKTMTKLETTTP